MSTRQLLPWLVPSLFSVPLPIANAAGMAGPNLNPCVERLGVERIGVSSRQFCSNRSARFHWPDVRNSDRPGNGMGFGFWFRLRLFWFRLRLRLGAAAIRVRFTGNRRKSGSRPKRLR